MPVTNTVVAGSVPVEVGRTIAALTAAINQLEATVNQLKAALAKK